MHIQTIEQLRTLYNLPSERAIRKEQHLIDKHIENFIRLSPLLVVASGNLRMQFDASPRGGDPGWVRVLDSKTLLVPDAPGNNRLDTLQNIISTSQIGLLFFVPGVDEMLRINGQASLLTDPELLSHFDDQQRRPKLVIKVSVEAAYLHCAKALMRSRLWAIDSQVDRVALPTMGQIIKDHAQLDTPAETQEEMLKRYESDL